ncbi:hypothetical protein MPTK1_2g10870 [Marchantia polymorpha subsp. ruderalis]|uniref:DUF4201 domain-containing protein n=1 Tax=Marchantia polymorpha TaxID=3197 RepID=A0A2R6XCA4_MARPO|nr:hypothetical protein MARPO_0023s0053 [Marchantia polymorpha]BBN01860.1 hypothetical protein Mp_2g10870 [Marchantia polymorpha subsp. ruderalis]|eukprot:PTQ43722.1 hypothetical protein MARPO_0023s0053 [Marchantia polymorpha]
MSQFVDLSARGMSLLDYDEDCVKAGPCAILKHIERSGSAAQHKRIMNAMRGTSAEPFDLAVKLAQWESDAGEPCPQLAGDSGGRWVVKSGGKQTLSLGLAPADEMGGSPRVKVISQVSRKLVLESRDKEMLLEQILDLKRSLFDQQIHLRHYKIQASMLDMENMRMHRDILDMEKPNCQSRATRLSHCMRLRARIFGLKNKLLHMQGIAESQDEEIHKLRDDSRMSHCREIEFERDVFLGEVSRLKGQIQKVGLQHKELLAVNQELLPYADKAAEAEAENDRLEIEKEVLENQMEKVNLEIKRARALANKSELEARAAEKLCKDQETRNMVVQSSINRCKADIPKMWKRLAKENSDYKNHKRDVKKGKKRLYG